MKERRKKETKINISNAFFGQTGNVAPINSFGSEYVGSGSGVSDGSGSHPEYPGTNTSNINFLYVSFCTFFSVSFFLSRSALETDCEDDKGKIFS